MEGRVMKTRVTGKNVGSKMYMAMALGNPQIQQRGLSGISITTRLWIAYCY